MSSIAEKADPLANVRHRASSMGGRPNYGLLGELTGYSLKLAWGLGQSLLSVELGDNAITPHRFSVLEVIACNPGMQQTELASALALSRSATTLALDFWEARDCVERCSNSTDRRSFAVFVTSQGKQELERLRHAVRAADNALTAALTTEDAAELRRLLGKIHQ